MVKRAALAFSSLSLAVVLLLNFQGPSEAAIVAATGGTGSRVASVGSLPAGGGSTSTGTTGTPRTAGPGATAIPNPATGSTASGTFAGSLVSTRYGDVQIQITLQNSKITAVQALVLPTGGRSGRISDIVGPMLRSEALAAQSASIDVISGATYTSRAYATSLQAALDAAGL